MTTAQTIVNDAYIEAKIANPIDGAESSDLTVGLRYLNRIIEHLSVENISIPYSTSENFSITDGTASYTMGSGGTASSTRAKRILSAYVRDSSGNDYPLGIISEKDYNMIGDKDLEGLPVKLFYDPVYATGVIYFYPVPDKTYTAYIESQKTLHSTLSLGTTLSLPSEYEELFVLLLAAKVARTNGAPTEQSLRIDADKALKRIQSFNLSHRVPKAVLPFSQQESDSSWLFNT